MLTFDQLLNFSDKKV